MIHLYLTLPHPETPAIKVLVDEILALNAGVGLVQTAAGGDEEIMRRVAGSHIRACDGLVAITDGALQPRQAWEVEAGKTAGIPILVLDTKDAGRSRPQLRDLHRAVALARAVASDG